MSNNFVWSSWFPLDTHTVCRSERLEEILNEGQSFRWNLLAESETSKDAADNLIWQGIWENHIARIRLNPVTGLLEWAVPEGCQILTGKALIRYLVLSWRRAECSKSCLPAHKLWFV